MLASDMSVHPSQKKYSCLHIYHRKKQISKVSKKAFFFAPLDFWQQNTVLLSAERTLTNSKYM